MNSSPTKSRSRFSISPSISRSDTSAEATALSTKCGKLRSGKQNILEGSKASGTSKETEVKLTNVARASLEEHLGDYEDYLRTRDFPIWPKIPAKPSM